MIIKRLFLHQRIRRKKWIITKVWNIEINPCFNQNNRYKNNIETNDALVNQIKGLDEQMQKEVTRIIEIMGTKLSSLSEKFVKDYTPLTNQLANLINSLGNIKQTRTKK